MVPALGGGGGFIHWFHVHLKLHQLRKYFLIFLLMIIILIYFNSILKKFWIFIQSPTSGEMIKFLVHISTYFQENIKNLFVNIFSK